MKFDYYVLNTYVPGLDGEARELYDKWLDQVELAEELGFTSAWFTEHHFTRFGGMLPSPHILIAALSQRTTRIRLGSAVTLLPMHNPLRIAEEVAMLDNLSQGRIDVGVGRGMSGSIYSFFNADWTTAQVRLQEQVQLLREAWSGEHLSWRGEFFQYPEVRPMPKPIQQPHPPLWMSASRELRHFRWIGLNRLNLMTLPWAAPSLEDSANRIRLYRASLREAGCDHQDFEVMAMFPAYVGETTESTRRDVEPHWANWREVSAEDRGSPDSWPMDFDSVVARTGAIFGDPDECRRQVQRIERILGITHLALVFHFGGLSQTRTLASMRLFASEVAAAFEHPGNRGV